MLAEDGLARVEAVGDDLLRNVTAPVGRHPAASHVVGRSRRRAVSGLIEIGPLAGFRVLLVGTVVAVDAGTRDCVQVIPDSGRRWSALFRREKRLPPVPVSEVVAGAFDVVLDDAGDRRTDRIPPLALLAVLEWRVLLGTMMEPNARSILVEVAVAHVEATERPGSSAGVPHQENQDVAHRRVVVPVQVFQNGLGTFGFQVGLADLPRFADCRERDLLPEAFGNGVDLRSESEEGPECRQLAAEGNGFDGITAFAVAFASPHSVRVEFAAAEVAEIVDIFFLAPLNERFQSVAVALEGTVREFVAAALHVHLHGFSGGDWTKVVRHHSPPLRPESDCF